MHQYAEWRHLFYYTLGLLPSIFFGLRFFIQWIDSEKKKHSHVNKIFWRLSFCGNLLLMIHYFIQVQFLLFLLQVANGYIAWRNLHLLRQSQTKITFKISILILFFLILLSSSIFLYQSIVFSIPIHFLEIPAGLIKNNQGAVSILWHTFGALGCVLFASRFWFQWLEAEKTGESRLNRNFWSISIIGSLSALLYFFHIKDWISCMNYSFGLIPYIRNLMLLKKQLKNRPLL